MGTTRFRRGRFVVLSVAFALAFAAAACSDDATPAAAVDVDGSTPPEGGDASNATIGSGKGSDPEDGGADPLADGGDGGPSPDDGGDEAGPACRALNPGPYVASTCEDVRGDDLEGGTLTSGRYKLEGVVRPGSLRSCEDFVPHQHRGWLEVKAISGTTATFEFLDEYRIYGSIGQPASTRYDVDVTASGDELTYSPRACVEQAPPAKVRYHAGTVSGKATLTLMLPPGYAPLGAGHYLFVEEE